MTALIEVAKVIREAVGQPVAVRGAFEYKELRHELANDEHRSTDAHREDCSRREKCRARRRQVSGNERQSDGERSRRKGHQPAHTETKYLVLWLISHPAPPWS